MRLDCVFLQRPDTRRELGSGDGAPSYKSCRSRGSRPDPPPFVPLFGEFTRSCRVCQQLRSSRHKFEGPGLHDRLSCIILFNKAFLAPVRAAAGLSHFLELSIQLLLKREELISSWPFPAILKPIHGTLKQCWATD